MDYEITSTYFTAEELNNRCNGLDYHHLSEVIVNLQGNLVKLEAAIKDGQITTDEIFAFARIDSENGYCKQTYSSTNGLTTFIYRYPTCELHVIYDVYETPDGKQHLIDSLSIYDPGGSVTTNHTYRDDEGNLIDKEDWGLTFTVANTSSTSLSIKCVQSGGQHLGELFINNIVLYSAETLEQINLNSAICGNNDGGAISIASNDETSFTLDLVQSDGQLIGGDYFLKIFLIDVYDQSTIHPLMKNYYDAQVYTIDVKISEE